jgi:hypothetical protein
MYSQRYERFRKGDRAEYLAQYILSAFSVCVPVPRQEDVGNDFHCSLLHKVGDNLRPYLAFNIQIKSSPDPITIGGVTKAGNWRRHEIELFCASESPFLIGIVDVDEQRLDLFSTASRYFVGRWKGGLIPRQIDLIPYQPEGEGHLGDGAIERLDPAPDMPVERWKLPVGNPIVQITIADSDDEQKREQIKGLLEPYLRMDQQNIVLYRLGLGYFEWPLIIRPNVPPRECGIGLAYGPIPHQFQLESMIKMIASLMGSYHAGQQKDKIVPWIPVLEQFNIASANTVIRDVIAKAVAYAKEKTPP